VAQSPFNNGQNINGQNQFNNGQNLNGQNQFNNNGLNSIGQAPFNNGQNSLGLNPFSTGNGQCGKRNARGITGRVINPGYVDGDTDYGKIQNSILCANPIEVRVISYPDKL